MSDALSIGLAGLQAATNQLDAAATAIVTGTTVPTASVATPVSSPSLGAAILPDMGGGDSLITDVVQMQTASVAYKASASVIRTAEQMDNTLLATVG